MEGAEQEKVLGWPSQGELEKWLMKTAGASDKGAGFLRKMLALNPAYGAYLVGDKDLAGIVQIFAKRFRQRILTSEKPMERMRDDALGKLMYEPLCELAWRVVGHLVYSMLELEDREPHLPVPKEILGVVRMLHETNVALHRKFNDARRAYLKELTGLREREREREISGNVLTAINSLQEQPVLFYEPLDFVLDEPTKNFVHEVIEERLKLGLQAKTLTEARTTSARDGEAEARDPDDEDEKAREIAEQRLKRVRGELSREQARADKLRDELALAKVEQREAEVALEKLEQDTAAGETKAALEDALQQVAELKEQVSNLSQRLKDAAKKEAAAVAAASAQASQDRRASSNAAAQATELEKKTREQRNELEKMHEKLRASGGERRQLAAQLGAAAQQLTEHREEAKKLRKELDCREEEARAAQEKAAREQEEREAADAFGFADREARKAKAERDLNSIQAVVDQAARAFKRAVVVHDKNKDVRKSHFFEAVTIRDKAKKELAEATEATHQPEEKIRPLTQKLIDNLEKQLQEQTDACRELRATNKALCIKLGKLQQRDLEEVATVTRHAEEKASHRIKESVEEAMKQVDAKVAQTRKQQSLCQVQAKEKANETKRWKKKAEDASAKAEAETKEARVQQLKVEEAHAKAGKEMKEARRLQKETEEDLAKALEEAREAQRRQKAAGATQAKAQGGHVLPIIPAAYATGAKGLLVGHVAHRSEPWWTEMSPTHISTVPLTARLLPGVNWSASGEP